MMNGFRILMLCLMAMLWLPAHAQKVTYFHTDALGSPVVATDAARKVVERSEYEPYGKVLNRPLNDGPGYTGHVEDAATGLIYAQQRYYDDDIGRFLSVDPVTPYEQPVTNFCRYCYAFNNPYAFTDPDGRQSLEKIKEFVLPSTMDLGSRGEPGTAADNLAGAAKQAFNQLSSAAGLASGNPVVMMNAPQLSISNNELAGASAVEVGTAAIGAMAGLTSRAGSLPSGLGDLTRAEAKAIQGVVNDAGRPLEVVGSAARGARTAVSDIDYVAPPSSLPNFRGLEGRLPSIDPSHGIIPGVGNPNIGPVIRFEPKN